MPAVDIKRQMFVANGVYRLATNDSWEYLPAIKALLSRNRDQPLDNANWQIGFQAVQVARRDSVRAPNGSLPSEASLLDRLLTWADSEFPGAMPITDVVRDALQRDSAIRILRQNETGRAAYIRGDVYDNSSTEAETVLGEMYDVSKTSPKAMEAWDRLMARDLGRVSATPEQILAENPALSDLLDRMKASPTSEAGLAALDTQVKTLSKDLVESRYALKLIKNSNDATRSALESMLNGAMEARRQQNEEIRRKTVEDALRGAVAIYSVLGGDKPTVHRISALLNAYSGARAAVNAYNTAIAAGSSAGVASMALAGGWVGVAMSLAAGFAEDDGKGPQEQLMEALSQISQQLADIQKQISRNFEYVDVRLSQLSIKMDEGFEAVLTGLESNKFELEKLLSAAYNLADSLDASAKWIAAKLDYAIDTPVYEAVSKYANWKQNSGQYLNGQQIGDAASSLAILKSRSVDEMHSGVELTNLTTDFDAWIRSKEADGVSDWTNHVNTFRSIAKLLDIPLSSHSAPNRKMWSFATTACIQVGTNNISPPALLGPTLVDELIQDGTLLIDEVQLFRNGSSAGPTGVEIIFEFLLIKYSEAIRSITLEVRGIHQEKLTLAGCSEPTNILFDEFIIPSDGSTQNFQVAHPTLPPTDQFGDPWPWINVRPSNKAEVLMPLAIPLDPQSPEPPYSLWEQRPGLADCVPSWVNPANWPAIYAGDAWNSVPSEVRIYASIGEQLGLGTLRMEYQAQIDGWRWQDGPFSNLVGIPRVDFVLFWQKGDRRIGLQCVTKYTCESHMNLVCCYSTNTFNLAPPFKLKSQFIQSLAGFLIAPPLVTPNFKSLGDLVSSVENQYVQIAAGINKEIQLQLAAPVSKLGEAAFALRRITDLIRGVTAWLLPDLLSTDVSLRTSLFGPTEIWLPLGPGWNVQEWLQKLGNTIPLIDERTLGCMVSADDSRDMKSATDWTNTQMLTNLEDIGDASSRCFRAAIKQRLFVNAPLPKSDDAFLLEQLRLFKHYFASPA